MYQWFSLWINLQFGAHWGVVCRFRAMGYAMGQKRRFREDETANPRQLSCARCNKIPMGLKPVKYMRLTAVCGRLLKPYVTTCLPVYLSSGESDPPPGPSLMCGNLGVTSFANCDGVSPLTYGVQFRGDIVRAKHAKLRLWATPAQIGARIACKRPSQPVYEGCLRPLVEWGVVCVPRACRKDWNLDHGP